MTKQNTSKAMLIGSMVIFGTIGIFRRYIPISSELLAMTRGYVGAVFLALLMVIMRKKPSLSAIRQNLILLIISGGAMGFNWVLLFEAYNYTSVATATLCYYMAPIFIIIASPFVLKERVTGKKLICVIVALVGMVLVSGVIETGISDVSELRGVLLGLAAALLYASVILMNKRLKPIPAYDKTVIQLISAAVVVNIYSAIAVESAPVEFTPMVIVMLAIVCIVHTGVAYALYFGSMDSLSAQTLALFSYIDPVLAVILSAALLHEHMGILSVIGAVLVLGSAMISELPEKAKKT